MCSALVCPRGLKNEECYLRMALRTTFVSCVALVLPRGFKNNECYMRMALRTTSISCVARLFGFMAESYFLCPLPTDFRWVRWTRARANCLRRIRSSLFANIFNPLAPVNLLLQVLLIMRLALISCSCGDRTQSACEWRRSDSGRVYWTCVIASGPAALPDFKDLMTLLTSALVGGLMFTSSWFAAGGMSSGTWGRGLLRISWKCCLFGFICDGLAVLVFHWSWGALVLPWQCSCDLIQPLHVSLFFFL